MLILMAVLLGFIDLKVIWLLNKDHPDLLTKARMFSRLNCPICWLNNICEMLIIIAILIFVGMIAPDPVTATLLLIYGVLIIIKFTLYKVAAMSKGNHNESESH